MKKTLFSLVSILFFMLVLAFTLFEPTSVTIAFVQSSIESMSFGSLLTIALAIAIISLSVMISKFAWANKLISNSGIQQTFRSFVDDLTVIAKCALALFTPAPTARQLE